MEILLVIVGMAVVGVGLGYFAGMLWPERPFGMRGDLLVGAGAAVVIGLIDWYVIPAMGFSATMKWLGILLEPALGALCLLWLVRWNARRTA